MRQRSREESQAPCDHAAHGITRTTGDVPGPPCCGGCGLDLSDVLESFFGPDNRAKWTAFLPTVNIGGALPVTFRIDDDHVVVEMIVPYVPPELPPEPPPTEQRNKIPVQLAEGFPIPVSGRFPLPPFAPTNAAEFLRQIVREIYHHEIDEQFRVDGKRPFAFEH